MTPRASPRPSVNVFDIVVRGEGIPALLAATGCARVGLRTALVSSAASDATVMDEALGVGADAKSTLRASEARLFASGWGGVVENVCAELLVECRVEHSTPGGERIVGIPGSPLSTPIRRVIGNAGAVRAYADRLRPLLAIGEEFNLARLVRSRLGSATLEKLVRPAAREELGCAPEDVDLRDVAPGLVQAMSRVGSLSLGVLELGAQDPSTLTRIYPVGGLRAVELAAVAQADYFAVSRRVPADTNVSAYRELDLRKPVFNQALHVGIPRARHEAQELWRSILHDPAYTPIGPVDLEQ